jgi:hypothetical protein
MTKMNGKIRRRPTKWDTEAMRKNRASAQKRSLPLSESMRGRLKRRIGKRYFTAFPRNTGGARDKSRDTSRRQGREEKLKRS